MQIERILIVASKREQAVPLYRGLRSSGYILLHAGNSQKALSLLSEEKIDLVIVAATSPADPVRMACEISRQREPQIVAEETAETDGYGLCRKLKSHPMGARVPLLQIVSIWEKFAAARALAAGADYFLFHPYEQQELVRSIRAAVLNRLSQEAADAPDVEGTHQDLLYTLTADRGLLARLLFSVIEDLQQNRAALARNRTALRETREQLRPERERAAEGAFGLSPGGEARKSDWPAIPESLELLPLALLLADFSGKITYVNRAAKEMFPGSAIPHLEALASRFGVASETFFPRLTLQTGRDETAKLCWMQKGTELFFQGSSQLARFPGCPPQVLILLLDITAEAYRKRPASQAEAGMLSHQAVQEFVHDFSNLLDTIGTAAAVLRAAPPQPSPYQAAMDAALVQAGELLAALRDIALMEEEGLATVRVDPGAVIREVLRAALLPLRAPNVRVRLRAKRLPPIRSNPTLLHRCLNNMVWNAIQAMPAGGTLSIRGYAQHGQVVLEVSDTGTGIPEDVQEKIFGPHFSTKEHHSGLGLSLVRNLVRRGGGEITVASRPGQGSTFTLSLPAAEPALALRHPAGQGKRPPVGSKK